MISVIGASGFIGSNFIRKFPEATQISREFLNSTEVIEVETLVIAAPGARKYEVNQNPEPDRTNILKLLEQIRKNIRPTRVLLFSTVDVYKSSQNSDEDSEIRTDLTYGGNRGFFEIELQQLFPSLHIRRLPGLFGPGLKKNIIFDLVHSRQDQLLKYSPKSVFQYIHINDGINLATDTVLEEHNILNVVTSPIAVSNIIDLPTNGEIESVIYNVTTKHHPQRYFFQGDEVIQSIKKYVSEEREKVRRLHD